MQKRVKNVNTNNRFSQLMKQPYLLIVLLIALLPTALPVVAQSGTAQPEKTWTFTYLKAASGQKERLKKYVYKNWFAMDSIAVAQKLIHAYELIENTNEADTWDFIVAVEYFTSATYADIEQPFERIRAQHIPVMIDGLTLKDLGKIVKSETVRRELPSH